MSIFGDAWNAYKKYTPTGQAIGAISGALDKPKVDLSTSNADIERTTGKSDAYSNERQGFKDRTDAMAPQQQGAINRLGDAADGRVKSAAELQLQQQGATDAARNFAMASAMKGHSPGSALRAATEGATATTAATNANAAILRATEQANARNQYATAIQGARGQNQNQMQIDDDWRKALLNADLTASGQATSGANAQVGAQTAQMNAEQQRNGAILGAAGSGLSLLSDERAKEHVKPRSLADALGETVHGVTFEYKPGQGDGGGQEHYGLLAQELEKTMPGVVEKGADGLRRVDAGQLTMGNTAVIAELAKRLGAVEGKRKAA